MLKCSNFQINEASEETLKPPDPLFLNQNRDLDSRGFRVPPLALFIWKLLYIGILIAKDHNKSIPNLEVGWPAHREEKNSICHNIYLFT